MKNYNKGFIALFSVIIITSVLLLVATTLSLSGFRGRFNIFDSESKKRSDFMADACIDSARLILALNYSPTPYDSDPFIGSETIENDSCDYLARIKKEDSLGEIISHGYSEVNNAHTYYKVVVDASTPETEIISFEQLIHYP